MHNLIRTKTMNKIDVQSLFTRWNNAVQTGNPKTVTELYEKDAILLPTISNKVRHNHKEIKDYFILFQENDPSGKIDESNVRNIGNITIHSGLYTFTFKDHSKVQARYTFVYKWNGQDWKIIEHHSSRMPELIVTN